MKFETIFSFEKMKSLLDLNVECKKSLLNVNIYWMVKFEYLGSNKVVKQATENRERNVEGNLNRMRFGMRRANRAQTRIT